MLAAPAHVTNAKSVIPGDASASQSGGVSAGAGADGFNGALAALMTQLGPATPPQPTTSPPASDRAASAGSASGPSKSFAPTPAKDAHGGPNAPDSRAGPANASDAGADDAAATATSGGQATANSAPQPSPSATPGQAATTAAGAAGQSPLDPRLIQFVAKPASAPASGSASTATATDNDPAQDPAAAAQTAIQDATQTAATATSADAAASTSDANGQVVPPAALAATLVSLGQLAPGSAPPAPTGAVPAKSGKAAQIQAAVGAAAKSLTEAATPASEVIKAGVAASTAGPPAADGQGDVAFALPHDDAQQSADAQAPPAPGNNDGQIPQPTTLAAPLAAATTAPATAAAMASSQGAGITAQLAAQISSRAGAPRAAFDFALDPQGLGRVDVTLKIDPQGQLSAVLSFDNPSAAAEAKGRAADLQQALQQAGFDVGQSGLSFTSTGGQGQGAAWQGAAQTSYGQTPVPADSIVDAVSPISRRGVSSAGGLDIII